MGRAPPPEERQAAQAGRRGRGEADDAGLLGAAGRMRPLDAELARRAAGGAGGREQHLARVSPPDLKKQHQALAEGVLVHSAEGERGLRLRDGRRAQGLPPRLR